MELFDEQELQCFDEEQREVLLQIKKRLGKLVATEVKDAVAEKEILHEHDFVGVDDLNVVKALALDKRRFRNAANIWRNNGRVPGIADRISYQQLADIDKKYTKEARDNLSSTDHPMLIGRVISEVVKEAIEPNIVLTGLLDRINFTHGTQLTFPAIGAMAAADIPEGGEYPERSLDMVGQTVATIGKSGIAVKMTEEAIRYSLYDLMSMHLRAAGRAMIRWKEQKVADMITANAGTANTLFDNTSATYASTTGRDFSGTYNGSLTIDDVFSAYATMVNRGFSPNTLIMNPFCWQIFADEAMQRLFGFINGITPLWGQMQGGAGNAPQWGNAGMNGLLQNTTVTDPQNLATTYTNLPGLFPYPFSIIVSPYMPYYSTSNSSNMVMCDRSQLGVLVVDEEVATDQWDDPARDIVKVKLRERYAVAGVNSGEGTGLLKGVHLGRSADFTHNIVTSFGTGDIGSALTGDVCYNAAVVTNS